MDPTIQASVERPGLVGHGARRRVWATAVALLAACGGTSGVENIVGGDGAALDSSIDGSIAESAGDAGGTETGQPGNDGATRSFDATLDDRTVPNRPPAKDTGVVPMHDASPGPATDARAEASAPLGTTLSILAAQSPNCLKIDIQDAASGNTTVLSGCAFDNGCLDPGQQGGVCEVNDSGLIPNTQGDGDVPLDVPPSAYTADCLQTLHDILASKCAQTLQVTPCICGTYAGCDTDPNLQVEPNGPAYQDFKKSLSLTGTPVANIRLIKMNITTPQYGAGQASALITCLAINAGGADPRCLSCFGLDGGSD